MVNPLIVQVTKDDQGEEVFTELAVGNTIVTNTDGVQITHPWQITEIWTDEELNAVGIYRVEPAEQPPNTELVSSHFERDESGKIIQVLETRPIEPPPEPQRVTVIDFPQPLELEADPENDMDAATKRYVDEAILEALQAAGIERRRQ